MGTTIGVPVVRIISVAVLVLVLVHAARVCASDNVTLALYPPEAFFPSGGAAVTRTFTVPSTQGAFALTVINGNG